MPRRQAKGPGTATPGAAPSVASSVRQIQLGDEKYLWILVGLEVAATAWLRNRSRGRHGG